MYKIQSNPTKNRLYITIEGKINMDEVEDTIAEIKAGCQKLKSGFSVISDIATFIPVDEEVRQKIADTMKYLVEHGMGKVIRVIVDSPTSQVTGFQWQRTSKEAGYTADIAPSIEEAERILDQN